MQKGFLDDVLSVFRVIEQSEHRVEESVLMATDQLSKGCGLALPAISDESVIVAAHEVSFQLDATDRMGVPQKGSLPCRASVHDGIGAKECQNERRNRKFVSFKAPVFPWWMATFIWYDICHTWRIHENRQNCHHT